MLEDNVIPTVYFTLKRASNEDGWVELSLVAKDRLAKHKIVDSFTFNGDELAENTHIALKASETHLDMPDYFDDPFRIVSKRFLSILNILNANIRSYPVQINDEDGGRVSEHDYYAIKIISNVNQLEEADAAIFYCDRGSLKSSIYVNQHVKAEIEQENISTLSCGTRAICLLALSFPGRYVCIASGSTGSPDFVYSGSSCSVSEKFFMLIKRVSKNENIKSIDDFQVDEFTSISFDKNDDSDIPVIFSTSDAAVYVKRELAELAIEADLDITFTTSNLFGSNTAEPKIQNICTDQQNDDRRPGPAMRMTMADMLKVKKENKPTVMNLFVDSSTINLSKDQLSSVLDFIDKQIGTQEVVSESIDRDLMLHVVVNEEDGETVNNCICEAFTSVGVDTGEYTIALSDYDPEDGDFEIPTYHENTYDL